MSAAKRSRAGRGLAAVLALLSVLMLLAVPAVAGRTHAAMPGMNMAGMDMSAQASAPLRHDASEALCVAACSLAGQLLPAQAQHADLLRQADAPVRYFTQAPPLAGTVEEPGSPPPR